MKIAINARFAGLPEPEGYARFTAGLVRAMAGSGKAGEMVMMYDRPPHPSSVMHDSEFVELVKGPAARHPLLWKIWYDLSMPAMARRAGADVIFSPDGFCSLRTRIPQVLAIHDLAFIHYPAGISAMYRRYYLHYTPQFIRKAAHIVTVSESSRDDIVRHYPQAAGKISVVHNAADPGFVPLDWKMKEEVRERWTHGQEYFLYVGAVHPRKNLVNLLKGFSWFKKRHRSGIRLVISGRLAWGNDDFRSLLSSYKYRDDVILTGFLPDEDLRPLMASAYALVYPSWHEGFGLPVLEAMQCGTPVICSGVSALPEVAGDAALFCDPALPEDWGQAMGHLYKDETYRAALISKGMERAKEFSWEESARNLYRILADASGLRG